MEGDKEMLQEELSEMETDVFQRERFEKEYIRLKRLALEGIIFPPFVLAFPLVSAS